MQNYGSISTQGNIIPGGDPLNVFLRLAAETPRMTDKATSSGRQCISQLAQPYKPRYDTTKRVHDRASGVFNPFLDPWQKPCMNLKQQK